MNKVKADSGKKATAVEDQDLVIEQKTKKKTPLKEQPLTPTEPNAAKKKPTVPNKPNSLRLIVEAIKAVNDRKGTSLIAIKKFVSSGKENISEQQLRALNGRTLKTVKQAVADGILVEKGKLRYGVTDKGKATLKAEKKKIEKTVKKTKAKDAAKAKPKETKVKVKAPNGGTKKKTVKIVEKEGSEDKKKPLIKGAKARKSLAKVAELNKKQKSTVIVLPKKTTKKSASKKLTTKVEK